MFYRHLHTLCLVTQALHVHAVLVQRAYLGLLNVLVAACSFLQAYLLTIAYITMFKVLNALVVQVLLNVLVSAHAVTGVCTYFVQLRKGCTRRLR